MTFSTGVLCIKVFYINETFLIFFFGWPIRLGVVNDVASYIRECKRNRE